MDVHKWLMQVKKLDRLIDAKLVEREQWLTMATRISPDSDGMPHGKGGVSDPVGNAVVKLTELIDEINMLVDKYVDHKKAVIQALEKLPEKEYTVLHKYYIQYMTWDDIANDMGYSIMQIWRYKKKALEDLKQVIECYTIPMV